MSHRNLIISAAQRDFAALLCETLSPAGGNMFQREVFTGTLVTDYISSGDVATEFANILPLTTVDAEGNETTTPCRPGDIVALAASKGLTVTLEQVTNMLAGADITDCDPFVRLSQLGKHL